MLFVKMGGGSSGWLILSWEMGWKIGMWWHMVKQMGDGSYEV